MAAKPLPPIEFLRERFSYDPLEGVVRWKQRPVEHFFDKRAFSRWNAVYPGTTGSLCADGYIRFCLGNVGDRNRVLAHRIAYALITGKSVFPELDHENRDKRDNRFANLRIADRSQNTANRDGWSKHGLPKGVTFRAGRFMANAHAGQGRTKHLGYFSSPAEAHAAFCAYAAERHGEFFTPGPAKPNIFD